MDKKINDIRKQIDCILETHSLNGLYSEEGSGRVVVIIDEFAIKLPWTHEENYDEKMSGKAQNHKEYEIYMSTKHDRLVPVYELYKDCLISKAIADMGELCRCGFRKTHTIEDIDSEIQKGIAELKDIIEKYELTDDVKARYNWGYDFETNKFLCLDYGY